ncbi:MAG: nitroreductase family protein [bacterium]
MDLIEAITNRRSIRAFKKEDVSASVIERILECGNMAPSAGNLQPRDFVVVRNSETKANLAEAALGQQFVSEAPVVIVVCANIERTRPYQKRGETLYCIQDTAAAIQNMLLVVHAEGLGACWVGAFNETMVSKILKLPGGVRPVALIPIGTPAEAPPQRARVPVSHLTHNEKW